jgi:hypothetical protein
MKWIPKKYMEHIDEVYKDSDGWWAYTKKGFQFAGMGCHTAHEDTQHELLKMIRTMEPCDCDQCMEPEIEVIQDEQASASESVEVVETELADFKRYTELLEIVYGTKTQASAEDQQELESLGYKLKLNGVPDIISEMNFNKLQNQLELEKLDQKLEVQQAYEVVEVEIFEPALEVRIRDKKTNQIESWYCQMFDSKQEYDQEVKRQFDLKDYYKQTHIFEIEHINLKYNAYIRKKFQFKHKDGKVIYDCKIHPDNVVELTWTENNIFHSSLCGFEHLKLSIKYGDWVVVQGA